MSKSITWKSSTQLSHYTNGFWSWRRPKQGKRKRQNPQSLRQNDHVVLNLESLTTTTTRHDMVEPSSLRGIRSMCMTTDRSLPVQSWQHRLHRLLLRLTLSVQLLLLTGTSTGTAISTRLLLLLTFTKVMVNVTVTLFYGVNLWQLFNPFLSYYLFFPLLLCCVRMILIFSKDQPYSKQNKNLLRIFY